MLGRKFGWLFWRKFGWWLRSSVGSSYMCPGGRGGGVLLLHEFAIDRSRAREQEEDAEKDQDK